MNRMDQLRPEHPHNKRQATSDVEEDMAMPRPPAVRRRLQSGQSSSSR